MALTDDERRYFDEKFKNLNDKVGSALQYGKRINALEIQMERRPTIVQVILACGFFLATGITLGATIF
mgnify:CR=1 FL=1